jgi:hypothetical protein
MIQFTIRIPVYHYFERKYYFQGKIQRLSKEIAELFSNAKIAGQSNGKSRNDMKASQTQGIIETCKSGRAKTTA